MTETITRISLSELNQIRMTCEKCGLATETTLGKAYKSMSRDHCPECDAPMYHQARKDALLRLNTAMTELSGFEDAEMQFVMPGSESNEPK